MNFKMRLILSLVAVLIICLNLLAGCAGLRGQGNSQPIPSTQAPNFFASPLDPIPGEDKMKLGEASVTESKIALLESYPAQAVLSLKGTLSTPCNHLRAKVTPPDSENRIQVEVYSIYDPNETCIQMLQAFETKISLGSFPGGKYTVWLNGKQVGEFTQ